MNSPIKFRDMKMFAAVAAVAVVAVPVVLTAAVRSAAQTRAAPQWTSSFNAPKSELASKGRNPYFILEPGFAITLQNGNDKLIITVLNDTKMIDGVETRVVEEREWQNSVIVEVSRNYFAISTRTNAAYYFGEDVDIYENGKITKHEGAWHSGENGAHFGMIMPGDPLIGARYYQEYAPKTAMDRAEIADLNGVVVTPAGRMTNVLRTIETSGLEKGTEPKLYAPGIGLIQEGELKLVKYGK